MALALAVALLDGETGVRAWWRIERDLAASRATNAGLTARNHELREEVRALEQDPFALERAIREDLDLVQPGEWLVRFRVPPGPHANPRFP